MECKSNLQYTTAKDGAIYKIADVAFDTKTDKTKQKPKPEPAVGVPPYLTDEYVVSEHAHQYETHDAEKKCKADHTAWPTSGLLVLERCENQCAFCGTVFKWTWFLRRHVQTIHVKRDYPNLTVAQSWTSPSGSLKRCEKRVRKAAKLARHKQAEPAPVDPCLLENTPQEPLPLIDWGFEELMNSDLEWEREFATMLTSAL